MKPKEFTVIVERDAQGWYLAKVPELRGCHTQAKSLDQLMRRIREAFKLCPEVGEEIPIQPEEALPQRHWCNC